jgi:iron complex transport system permease protein
MMTPRGIIKPAALTFLALAALSILSLCVGTIFIPPHKVAAAIAGKITGVETEFSMLLISIRLPRLLTALFVGAALAGSGSIFQSLIRNPLGDPYLIGVSSGAALGMITAQSLSLVGTIAGLPIAAIVGGTAAVIVVYLLSKSGGKVHTTRLILAGIVVSAFLSASAMFILSRSDSTTVQGITFWMMGDMGNNSISEILGLAPLLFAIIAVVFLLSGKINVIMLGDDLAAQMGIPVETIKVVSLVAASILTGLAVAAAGVIGFIGLIVPNLVRYIWGSDFRFNFLFSTLAGALLLLMADIIVRLVSPVSEIPVGVITALIGAPFFINLLIKSKD